MFQIKTKNIDVIHEVLSAEQIKAIESYGKNISEFQLPVIYSADHFSKLIGVNERYIYAAANNPKRFYRKFRIRKKSGGWRVISEPLPLLKAIQRWILDNILVQKDKSNYAKSYRVGLSTKSNAKFHVGQECVVKYDLEGFLTI